MSLHPTPNSWAYTSTLKSLHMSTLHRVTPPPRTYIWGQKVHSLHSDSTSKTLTLPSLVHSLQGEPTSQTMYLTLHFQFPEQTQLPDPTTGVTCPHGTSTVSWVTPLPRPYTWDQTSSVQGDPPPHTLHLGLHVTNLQGDPPPRSCTCSHMSTSSRVTSSQTLDQGHMSTV